MPGPYLAAAVICEKDLEERDGVHSLVRIVDRVEIEFEGSGPPGPLPSPTLRIGTCFVSFKSGDFQGTKTLEIRSLRPDGELRTLVTVPVLFQGEEAGINVRFELAIGSLQGGLYWFEVLLDGEEVTRVPLRVAVKGRLEEGSPSPPGSEK